MKKIILFLFISLASALSLRAAIIQVNAGDNLQTVINNAAVGDVLLVSPGTYGAINLNKRLTLIGTGYLFPANAPSTGVAAITGDISILAAADGSIITGFTISGSGLSVGANNIIFSRCLISTGYLYIGWNGSGYANTSNTIVKQCKILSNSVTIFGLGSGVVAANYQFLNNIFDLSGIITLSHGSESSGIFINNSFSGNLTSNINIQPGYTTALTNVSFYNNIFGKALNTNGSYLLTAGYIPNNFHFNVMVGNGVPETNAPSATNLINQTSSSIYAGFPSNPMALTADARNILASGSPAMNYGRLAPYLVGSTATNAGAYGGAEPYVTSGIPVGPYSYEFVVPNVAANNSNIQIRVKAKSNN
jgi:hypothetical protein